MLKTRTIALVALSLSAATTLGYSVNAQFAFGADKIKFPEGFEKGVLYTTVDRPDNKQYRELFTSPEAVAAAKKGEPLPSGTVITLVQYKAKLDAQGNPEKDDKGRFIKGDLIGYAVMEKRTGWGAQYPAELRNGEWEYSGFKADRTFNDKANLKGCFECHKPLDPKWDFVFSYNKMGGR